MLRLYTRDPEYCLLTERRSAARNNVRTSNFKHSVRLVFPLTHGIPALRDLRGRALSAALKASYIFDPRTHHKIWIWETLKVWSANSVDSMDLLCVCECCWSVYISEVMPSVLNAVQTRNKAYDFSARWFIRRFEGPCRFSVLYAYVEHQVLQFFSHSLLPNHHCKYRAMSS